MLSFLGFMLQKWSKNEKLTGVLIIFASLGLFYGALKKNMMSEMKMLTLPAMLQQSFSLYGKQNSLVFAGEGELTYRQLQRKVEGLALQLRRLGIEQGQKVAILSSNGPHWGTAYFAIGGIGAVVVPVLPDFHVREIGNILDHAEVKAIFISRQLRAKIDSEHSKDIYLIAIEDFSVELNHQKIKTVYSEEEHHSFEYTNVQEEDLLSIIYTSGTTGTSKGVMLTHRNIIWTARQSRTFYLLKSTDRLLSVLPLSHAFENTIGLIYPVMQGCSVHYLRKPPTATVLLPLLKQVRPTAMLAVPLIIEKIYQKKILPQIRQRRLTRWLFAKTSTRKWISRMAGKQLLTTFGGELKFFGIGGAKLDNEVERFLMDAHFPLAIGYGLTETSPLLAGAVGKKVRYLSTGVPLEGVELRIFAADVKSGEGEIQARGANVMQGYFKEASLTADAFTKDGWFRTGDRGRFDRSGFLYVKGRIKNMIVGSSGENIYPEEIESVINRMEYVMESLVVQQKGRLVAMVHLNMEEIDQRLQSVKEFKNQTVQRLNSRIEDILEEIQKKVNEEVNKFSRIQLVVLQPVPFEKTPTQKIKRFLYD